MAHHTILYGRIIETTWKKEDYYQLHRLKEEISTNLPEEDLKFL